MPPCASSLYPLDQVTGQFIRTTLVMPHCPQGEKDLVIPPAEDECPSYPLHADQKIGYDGHHIGVHQFHQFADQDPLGRIPRRVLEGLLLDAKVFPREAGVFDLREGLHQDLGVEIG